MTDDIGKDSAVYVGTRPRLDQLNISEGVRSKLHRMFYQNGPGNGTFLGLPFDQFYMEHGPLHQFTWEREDADVDTINSIGRGGGDIRSVAELVNKGNFSAYVLPGPIARKFKHLFNPENSLIYKIDGHLTQPKDAATASTIGSVEEALKLGADGIGITFYPGGEEVGRDMERINYIVEASHEAGMPVFIWSYARGPGLDKPLKEGDGVTQADSLYWVNYAVAAAEGLGADVIKTKFPVQVKDENRKAYGDYMEKLAKKNSTAIEYLGYEPAEGAVLTPEHHIYRVHLVTRSVPGSFLIGSGGVKTDDPRKTVVNQTRLVMPGGGEGQIVGRNAWGVTVEEGLALSDEIMKEMQKDLYARELTEQRFTI